MPGNRGVWVKTKFLNRQEFVIVGWTDPEGSRSSLGSLLLGYYRDDGKLIYAGRAGTGMTVSELTALLKKTPSARLGQDVRRRAAAESHALRHAARAFARALGAAGTGRRGHLPDLDRRRAAAACRL
jgi:ATP-dependent DNA ligase